MKKYCICLDTLIPVRFSPSERAEMCTQLLFGELYTLIEMDGKWAKILSNFDNYEGWIDLKLVKEIPKVVYDAIAEHYTMVSILPLSSVQNISKNRTIPLAAGSSLPLINEKGEFAIADHKFFYREAIKQSEVAKENIIKYALQFENAPYLWGGRTLLGIDCSGLSQIAYKMVGIALPRDASMQINMGSSVNFIAEAQAGDLAFFDNDEGLIIHVGILLNNHEIIHASGWVKIEKIDHQGIFNADQNVYSHKLRMIKRILK